VFGTSLRDSFGSVVHTHCYRSRHLSSTSSSTSTSLQAVWVQQGKSSIGVVRVVRVWCQCWCWCWCCRPREIGRLAPPGQVKLGSHLPAGTWNQRLASLRFLAPAHWTLALGPGHWALGITALFLACHCLHPLGTIPFFDFSAVFAVRHLTQFQPQPPSRRLHVGDCDSHSSSSENSLVSSQRRRLFASDGLLLGSSPMSFWPALPSPHGSTSVGTPPPQFAGGQQDRSRIILSTTSALQSSWRIDTLDLVTSTVLTV
jgi:hypothetical protein